MSFQQCNVAITAVMETGFCVRICKTRCEIAFHSRQVSYVDVVAIFFFRRCQTIQRGMVGWQTNSKTAVMA
jgi:hypothetical protein